MGRDEMIFLRLEQKIWWYFLQQIAWCFSQSSLQNLDETLDTAGICWDLWVQSSFFFVRSIRDVFVSSDSSPWIPCYIFLFFQWGESPQNFHTVESFASWMWEETKELLELESQIWVILRNFPKKSPWFFYDANTKKCLNKSHQEFPAKNICARDFLLSVSEVLRSWRGSLQSSPTTHLWQGGLRSSQQFMWGIFVKIDIRIP